MMKKIIISCLCVLMLASCSKEDIAALETEPDGAEQTGGTDESQSKSICNLSFTDVASGIDAGVYIASASLSSSEIKFDILKNAKLMNTNGTCSFEYPFYWPELDNHYDIYAYQPYQRVTSDLGIVPFSVNANQSTQSNYDNSDFMWGRSQNIQPSADSTKVVLRHVLSLINVKFTSPVSYDDLKVYVNNVSLGANISVIDGTVTSTGSTPTSIKCLHKAATDTEKDIFSAVIIPQTLQDKQFLTIVYKGDEYTYSGTQQFKPGKTYTVKISDITDGDLQFTVDVTDWVVKESRDVVMEEE